MYMRPLYCLLLVLAITPLHAEAPRLNSDVPTTGAEIVREKMPPSVIANKQLVSIIELLRQLQVLVLGKDADVDETLADIVRRLFSEEYGIKLLSSILPKLKAAMLQLAKLPETEFARPYYNAIRDAIITLINSLYKNGEPSFIDIPAA